jgi:MazG family protein
VLEEAFEVVDAIDEGQSDKLKEELGDLLLQIVFQAQIADESEDFAFDDVADAIAEKMISRHPHVFGDDTVADAKEVAANWELIKAKEKRYKGALAGVPKALPSLLRALRVGEKAAAVGFDWQNTKGPEEKVVEEWEELIEAIESGSPNEIEHELGDLLFAITSVARHVGVDAESALQSTVTRFQRRFEYMEKRLKEMDQFMNERTLEELDVLWGEAKALEASKA